MLAPVILFGFNRARHIEEVVRALSNNTIADKSDLFVFIDKPEIGDISNIERQREVVSFFEREMPFLKSCFKNVNVIEATKHKGCRNSIVDAVNEIIHIYGKAIMVEDDILTSPDFLELMNDMLDYYQEDKRVFTVGGYSEPLKSLVTYDKDVYALYRATSWGWATWSDRFDMIDFKLGKDALNDKDTMKRLKRGGADLPGLLKNELLGLSDAWDVQLAYAHAKYDKISVVPTISRVYNIGLDNSGTHCTDGTTQSRKQQKLRECTHYMIEKVDVNPLIAKEFYRIHSYDFIGKIKRNLNLDGIRKIFGRIRLRHCTS